jgi:hypothetical protein
MQYSNRLRNESFSREVQLRLNVHIDDSILPEHCIRPKMSASSAESETRKRARSASEESDAPGPALPDSTAAMADDSDDEIGPMPVPDDAGQNGHAKKKKRAGKCELISCSSWRFDCGFT